MNLFLRIAPELYLKRLITGGLERVFEINRNFRNEGISTFHNPEFTMMEFYQAYATYEDLMGMTEELITDVSRSLSGSLTLTYQGNEIDLTPHGEGSRCGCGDRDRRRPGGDPQRYRADGRSCTKIRDRGERSDPPGKVLMAVFDETVEAKLTQPTFVTITP